MESEILVFMASISGVALVKQGQSNAILNQLWTVKACGFGRQRWVLVTGSIGAGPAFTGIVSKFEDLPDPSISRKVSLDLEGFVKFDRKKHPLEFGVFF